MGYRREAARVAGGGPRGLPGERPARLPRGRHTGRGKTTYALRIATELLDRGMVRAVTVVAPTEHLKTQWADAAGRYGIQLNPSFSNSSALQSDEYDGVALTYAQVASKPQLHGRRTDDVPTLVILDEIHHGGDARSWGDGIREAFEGATRRLSLTGTPFRSDTNPIPFVRYEMGADGILRRPRTSATGSRGAARRRRAPRCSSSPTAARCAGAPRPATRWPPGSASRSPRTRPPRPGAPRSTQRGSGCRRCSPPPTSGSARCAATCPMPVGWSSPRTRPPLVRTPASCAASPVRTPRSWCPTTPGRVRASSRSRRAPRAGWSPCGWSRRGSTSRGCASASTRRRPRPRCSSPRRSAGSCGPGAAVRRPRCSCRRCR